MPPTTPIAATKTAALARVLDSVPKGYHRYTMGTIKAEKAEYLARKFHAIYGIGCSPAQRLSRKAKGLANALLVLHWPEGSNEVQWLLLATDGAGLQHEKMRSVKDKPHMRWLGYELVRYTTRGRVSWTWRRPKDDMRELHLLVATQAARRQYSALRDTLARAARQPGFHGVRTQTKSLCALARRSGYAESPPPLFYAQKVSHGPRLEL